MRDALLLAAREMLRVVLRAMGDLHERERFADTLVHLARRHVVERKRHGDVLLGGEERQQVEDSGGRSRPRDAA